MSVSARIEAEPIRPAPEKQNLGALYRHGAAQSAAERMI